MKRGLPHENYDVKVISTREEYSDYASLWDELLGSSHTNTIYLSSAWLKAWWESLGRGKQLVVPLVFWDGKLVAATAIQANRGILEFAAADRSDYADFLVAANYDMQQRRNCLQMLLSSTAGVIPNFRHFRLDGIPSTSPTLDLLQSNSNKFHAIRTNKIVAPTMDMTAVNEKLKKKSLKRHHRGLSKRGELTFETFTRSADVLPKLGPFFEQHIQRWGNTNFPSLFTQSKNQEFYCAVTKHLDSAGTLRFAELRLDGRLIAAHFGFFHAGKYIWYKPTFDVSLAKYSPGEVLIKCLLEAAMEEGAVEFDFTIGNEAFKHRFATRVPTVTSLYITDSRIAAWVKLGKVRARRLCKSISARARKPG